MAETFQFGAQFEMVVDFAVEDDGRAGAGDRLVAAVEIDDLQSGRAERHQSGFEDSLFIGPAMNDRVGGAADALGAGNPVFMCKADDAAHESGPLR